MRTLAREAVFKYNYSKLFNSDDEGLFDVLIKDFNDDDKNFATALNNAVNTHKEDFLNEIFDRVDWQSFTNHNVSTTSHSDIRELITDLTNRLNTLANSDDVTLDQMSELVAYIKNNRGLIDGITTSKINVADIVDNLTTASSNKVLSANQGVVLKSLIGTEVKKVQDTIGAIESGKTVVGMLAEMRQAYENGESQALSKAKDYTDAEINKVKSTIGTVTEGKTVMELLAESRTTAESNAKTYAEGLVMTDGVAKFEAVGVAAGLVDGLANGAVKTNTEAIAVINGSAEGSIAKAKADAIADAAAKLKEVTDTLKSAAFVEVATLESTMDSKDATNLAAAKTYAATYTDELFGSFKFAETTDIDGLFATEA